MGEKKKIIFSLNFIAIHEFFSSSLIITITYPFPKKVLEKRTVIGQFLIDYMILNLFPTQTLYYTYVHIIFMSS